MSKPLFIAAVAALGLVVGLLWVDDDEPARTTAPGVSNSTERVDANATAGGAPQRDSLARTVLRPLEVPAQRSFEPTSTEQTVRELQQHLHERLGKFYARAALTEQQRERFEADLWDLAEVEWTAYRKWLAHGDHDAGGVDEALAALNELRDESGRELEGRAASYLDERQLTILRRFRPDGLVSLAHRAHLGRRPYSPDI